LGAQGCTTFSGGAGYGQKENSDVINRIVRGQNVIFISAHPDDEVYVSSLLGFAADYSSGTILCATAGQSGGCFLAEASPLTLGEVRTRELAKAAARIGVSSVVYGCKNGISMAHPNGTAILESGEQAVARWIAAGEDKETAEQAVARWRGECPEFAAQLRKKINSLRPCIVITFDPEYGMTGHNEHRALSLVVQELFNAKEKKNRVSDDVSLFYVIHPDRAKPEDLRISSAELTERGGRDYVQNALEAFAVHESQLGPTGSPGNNQALADYRHLAETLILRPVQ